jgi:hypothetical protein
MAYMYSKHTFEIGDLLVDDDPYEPNCPLLVLDTYWDSDECSSIPNYKVLNLRTGDIENHHKVEIELVYRRA